MNTDMKWRDGTTRASDGCEIGYRSAGEGPGVVIVHGSMQSGDSQRELAEALAGRFQVHLFDRRGRGRSGPYPAQADTALEVGDLLSVMNATGARRALGISSGAIIAARAALSEPATFKRLAMFEPPLAIDGSVRLDLLPRVRAAADRGDWSAVLGIGMKLAEMGPPWMFRMPAPLLSLFSRRMLATPDGRALAHALPVDFGIVEENADRVADFAGITSRPLLIDGTATRPYLRKASAALAAVIPGAERAELPGLTHSATQNRDAYGRPDLVAPTLSEFFRS
jgi:pimeloyl-ACP methyl ester carboxylesterase